MSAKGARRLLLAGTATIASMGTAHAQSATTGTAAGTTITNTATASYTVNGTAGTATSNTATFLVDRKVNLTVIASPNAPKQVNLDEIGAYTTFQVTNNTNDVQDFALSTNQTVLTGILTGTDTFNLADLQIYVDSNGNGVYDPADTKTFIDELAPDGIATVFVVGNIPSSVIGTMAQVGLRAQVAAGGGSGTLGAPLVQNVAEIGNRDNVIDVVFADDDNDGLLGADGANDGGGWAYGSYEIGVTAVDLKVVKTATVLTDGVLGGGIPRAVPGAVVQYCLTVTNATLLTPATGVNLTDVIPANTTYVPESISVGGLGVGGVCLTNGIAINDDGTPPLLGLYRGSFDATTKTVTATIPVLAGGTSVAASFRVKIN